MDDHTKIGLDDEFAEFVIFLKDEYQDFLEKQGISLENIFPHWEDFSDGRLRIWWMVGNHSELAFIIAPDRWMSDTHDPNSSYPQPAAQGQVEDVPLSNFEGDVAKQFMSHIGMNYGAFLLHTGVPQPSVRPADTHLELLPTGWLRYFHTMEGHSELSFAISPRLFRWRPELVN